MNEFLVPLMLFNDNTMITPNQSNSKPRNINSKQSNQISLHGSLMFQYMIQYKDTHKLSKSLLSLETRELVNICCDTSGSHAIDAFLKSSNVADKPRLQFIDKLSGHFVQLACNKYGSRVIG